MQDVDCPRCGLINPSSSKRCDCGWEFIERPPVFRSGNLVIVEDGATLPPRCIRCNCEVQSAPIRYTFVNSAVGGQPHGMMTGIIHLWTRRTGVAYVSLCTRHGRRRSMTQWGGALLIFCAAASAAYANIVLAKWSPGWMAAAVGAALAGTILLRAHYDADLKARVSGRLICISGAGQAFLDSLPEERAND
jgi:hypothetical protein